MTRHQKRGWPYARKQLTNAAKHIPLLVLCLINLFPMYFMIVSSFPHWGYWPFHTPHTSWCWGYG